MVGHTTPSKQNNLLKILIAISERKAEDVADVISQISEKTDEFDAGLFSKRIAQLVVERQGQALGQTNVGRTLLQVTRSAGELGAAQQDHGCGDQQGPGGEGPRCGCADHHGRVQKIANRITSGVILTALIVGASLMMRIETSWTLLRLPRPRHRLLRRRGGRRRLPPLQHLHPG